MFLLVKRSDPSVEQKIRKKRVLERWLLLLLDQAVGNVLNAAGVRVVVDVDDAVLLGYTFRRSF